MRAARERIFGLVDEAEAARSGYTGDLGREETDGAEPRMPDAEFATLTGTDLSSGSPEPAKGDIPEEGCAGEAMRELAGDTELVGTQLLDELTMHTAHQAEADERVKGEFREWSACMKAEGFAYADPWQPNDSPEWVPGKPTPLEKKTAVADVRCKHSTGLIDTWYAVMVEYQRTAIEQHAAELDRLRRSTATRTANAEKVLAAGR